MTEPLSHLREYVAILRDVLWEGTVERRGRFFTANATLAQPPRVPILVSALGAGAFQLAGEISDGAISWNCPPSYLLDVALPALRLGAEEAGRPVPPLVAHAWVAMTSDVEAVRAAARKRLGGYARLPFYANMFEAAGFPVPDGTVSDALIDNIVIMGDETTITGRLAELLDSGLDELLLTIVPLDDEAADRSRLLRLIGRV
jgi:alkanesulfonate monooxygenase SsuD/methylene tetrahydromethanopterin reductase-like flavin-dependent oxidoreductase (luciferase family)